ncbi:hypothetical protein [Dyella mobilis]|uniref:Uncharacterized protein n=1 Tax=Dyella mobilis TaxID=1849582 RepID=A0ABS2KEB0_9GAMM|nr:hypothetical protein [Dyella mobilis]MBM7129395.1 hypothetical protein [Dyella mobilis]GLQ98340.1 hypothetical protein GCM10007863_27600 [Dyella mobilis]
MTGANRPLDEVDAQLLAACHSMGVLADHIASHGLQEQPLINLERVADGFQRLTVERRAALISAGIVA